MSKRIGTLVALLVGTIAAAGLGETVLRVVYRHDYVWPSHRNWRLRKVWDERFAPLNAFGFRDREHSSTKPEGVFRIVAIGDSLTYGVGIESPNDRYTAVLEQRLNRSGPRRVEVLNCAIPAWNVLEYANAVKPGFPRWILTAGSLEAYWTSRTRVL